jgi:ATP-grasp domain
LSTLGHRIFGVGGGIIWRFFDYGARSTIFLANEILGIGRMTPGGCERYRNNIHRLTVMKVLSAVLLHQVTAFLTHVHALFSRRASVPWLAHNIDPSRFLGKDLRCGHSASPHDLVEEHGQEEEDLEDSHDIPIDRILLVMDGLCAYHGGYLAARARSIPGVAVVPVLSDYVRGYFEQSRSGGGDLQNDEDWNNMLSIPDSIEDVPAWKESCLAAVAENARASINPSGPKWLAVYCESDSGLADAERLRESLQTECQDTPTISLARRHKHLQQQVVSQAGLAVAQFRLCGSVSDAIAFAQELLLVQNHTRVVVKPFRGVASEAVYLCSSVAEVHDAWDSITASQVFGSSEQHTNVLVQEFIDGIEYAVDAVSRHGQHKVAAIWRYVKQPANGASFCYFKTELVDSNSVGMSDTIVKNICDYVQSSLTALGVEWGLTHTEVIVPYGTATHSTGKGGPMLVEVNCRQHNMDFIPLTMRCIGYNAFDMMLAAMLGDESDWDDIPDRPVLVAHGCMVHLVNYAQAGRLTHNNHLQAMVDLPSVMDCEVYEAFCTPGSYIEPTVDIRSDAGWAQLVNQDADELHRDYEQIVRWMPTMFATQQGDIKTS